MPSSELVGVKTNIGLVVITNISIFIFLIQVITHLMYTESKTKECANFKFEVKSSVK